MMPSAKASLSKNRERVCIPLPPQPKAKQGDDLGQSPRGDAHYLPTDTCNTDPDLAAVVAAWPDLPGAIRTGILAMVKAAKA
jgi:hypothetical protein